MADIIKIGVIGVGVQGARHARVLNELYGCALAGVSDIDPAKGMAVAKEQGCNYYPDFHELLSKSDAAVVAVPTPHHSHIATRVLGKGVPTLLEKPIAGSVAEAMEIISASKAGKAPLMVGHIERFNPAVRELAKIIPSLEVLQINATRHNPPLGAAGRKMGVNVAVDLMIHDIDVVRYLLGIEPREILAVGGRTKDEHESHMVALVPDRRGHNLMFSTNTVTQKKVRRLEVIAKQEYIDLDYIDQSLCIYKKSTPTFGGQKAGVFYQQEIVMEKVEVFKQEPLRVELRAFADCVRSGKEPEIGGEDALENLKLALDITKKAQGK